MAKARAMEAASRQSFTKKQLLKVLGTWGLADMRLPRVTSSEILLLFEEDGDPEFPIARLTRCSTKGTYGDALYQVEFFRHRPEQ